MAAWTNATSGPPKKHANGAKGGRAIVEKYGAEHMSEIGRKGARK
jgi:general stress protein YciG